MSTRTICKRDVEGYLVDPEDWDRSIAAEFTAEENIDLTDEYWPIIDFVRDYSIGWSIKSFLTSTMSLRI